MRLTVIPSDGLIIHNGKALQFEYEAPVDLHALHYDGEVIRKELKTPDGIHQEVSTDTELVNKFLEAFRAEELRHEAEQVEPTYADLRRQAIQAEWSTSAQLEALTEAAEDPPRPEKLQALLGYIQQVKLLHPKE